jgi:phage shock protein PspC (stress-responsive transcriptional regulator)
MADEPRDPAAPQDPPTPPTDPPTPGADVPPAPRRLTRSSSDRLIGGVGGGLGRYFGIDPVIFRIAFVVLTFFGGVGVLAYIGLLAFVPSDGPPGAPQNRFIAIAGAVALGVAAIVLIGGPVFFLGPVLVPLALVALVGLGLWRAAGGGGLEGDPARVVGRIALAALLGIAALGAFAGVGAAAAFGGGVAIAVLAIVAGVTLIGAAFVGGARWMIVPALVLVLPLGIVAAADLSLDGGVGDREYRPGTMSELRDSYELGAGQLVVDLRDVDLPAGRTELNLDVGVGEVIVVAPADACVSSDVRIGIGHSEVLGRDSEGVDVAYAASVGAQGDAPEVRVDADVGIGALQVRRGDLDEGGFDRDSEWLDVPEQPACP